MLETLLSFSRTGTNCACRGNFWRNRRRSASDIPMDLDGWSANGWQPFKNHRTLIWQYLCVLKLLFYCFWMPSIHRMGPHFIAAVRAAHWIGLRFRCSEYFERPPAKVAVQNLDSKYWWSTGTKLVHRRCIVLRSARRFVPHSKWRLSERRSKPIPTDAIT